MAHFTDEEINQILQEFYSRFADRTYVGARYVPIIGRRGESSAAWDDSKPYEPLTIVLYEGDSYTSKQYVPAGIDISNTDFWAQTGNYNAQLASYQETVNDFMQDTNLALGTHETAIETLNGKVADLEESTEYNDFADFQKKVGVESDSRYPLYTGTNFSFFEASDTSTAIPYLRYWPHKQEANIVAAVQVTNAITSSTSQETPRNIFTSLPKPDTSYTIPDCITYTNADGELCTAPATYTRFGVFRIATPKDSDHDIPAGATLYINTGNFKTLQWAGDFTFPTKAYFESVISEVSTIIAAWKNTLAYSTNLREFLNPDVSGKTDCSGLIASAFLKCSSPKYLPDFASIQSSFGRIIASAKPGDDLDFTNAVAGDVVCYYRAGEDFAFHVAWYDGTKLWEQNSSFAYTSDTLGPQDLPNTGAITKENFLNTRYRTIVRWKEFWTDYYKAF